MVEQEEDDDDYAEQVNEEEEEDYYYSYLEEEGLGLELGSSSSEEQEQSCGKGHRRSLVLHTSPEGGKICLVCFSALVSDPSSLSHHVSYALSQLSLALSSPPPLTLQNIHHHDAHLLLLLVSPLVRALVNLSNDDDDALARQLIHLITHLSSTSPSLSAHFITRFSHHLSSTSVATAIAWNQRRSHFHLLHCFGVLLNSHNHGNPTSYITDKISLYSNLVTGLRLPSEELRGEILFVLYKLSDLQATPWNDADATSNDGVNSSAIGFKFLLLRLSLEALLKTQHDDVRMNCLALLTILAHGGFFENLFTSDQSGRSIGEANNLVQTVDVEVQTPLIILFADAVKGSLLSSDTQVQIRTLDLIFHSLSSDTNYGQSIQAFVEENIADYVFEILRLSGNKDPLVISCLQVLILLATAQEGFRQRLAIGFPTLLSVLHYVADIPLHPVQSQVLQLVLNCISDFPGVMSMAQTEEIALILTNFFRRHISGELSMQSETLILACSTFIEILKSPTAVHMQKLAEMTQEASRYLILFSFSLLQETSSQLSLYSLYLLKQSYIYSLDNKISEDNKLAKSIIETCRLYLFPWLEKAIDGGDDEEVILDVIETFHQILLRGSTIEVHKFAVILASSSWISLSFRCLALFPSDEMKSRVYLMLSSVLDSAICPEFGQPIRDAYVHLPPDPIDLLFLLGQRGSFEPHLTCQRAVLLILYFSSLYSERYSFYFITFFFLFAFEGLKRLKFWFPNKLLYSLADNNQVLASLEQYVLVNSSNFSCGAADSMMLTQLVLLYGLARGNSIGHRSPYSLEAEKALFTLIVEQEWDFLAMGVHPLSLKWLFQQEEIIPSLLVQILHFCRLYSSNKTQINFHATEVQTMGIQNIAELVISGDNCMASLLISLLKQVHEDCSEESEYDMQSVVNVMAGILDIYPEASNQFCLQGISDAFHHVYSSSLCSSHIFTECSILIFNILYSANHTTLSEDGEWFKVTVKLLEFVNPKLASHSFDEEGCLVIGIFCLILYHSTSRVLREASLAILLNKSLICAVENIVQMVCAKGPSLVDREETTMGECLIFVLLLYFFSLKSLNAIFQETFYWQDFLQPSSDEVQQLPVICIKCHDLCRLIHFGTSLVKLVASHCLVEVLSTVSDRRNRQNDDELLRCSSTYLESIISVIEGFVFYDDCTVATNCGICLSLMINSEKLGLLEKTAVIKQSKWLRLILEELAMNLVVPSLASKYLTNQQHKSAARIAATLLRLDKVPGWIRSIFDTCCITGIVENLSANNVSAEMVMLFRELMTRKFLNEEQVARLHQLFQVCRKQVYKETFKEALTESSSEKLVSFPDVKGKICGLLLGLTQFPATDSNAVEAVEHNRLLAEIDTFFEESSALSL